MFRQPLLPCACLALALGCAGLAVPVPAWSQDSSTQERLDRLERDLNMLQRQVYRGAPPPAMAGDSGGAAVNIEVRMDRLEARMRDLTGRVEEFTNQIDQIRQRVEQINGDVDMRLGQSGAGPGATATASATPAPPRAGSPSGPARAARRFPPGPPSGDDEDLPPPPLAPSAGPGSLMPPGTPVPPPGGPDLGGPNLGEPDVGGPNVGGPNLGGPTPIFGTLTPPGSPAPPSDLASAAPAGQPPAAGLLPSGSATQQYNHAFGLLKQANYPDAEAALKAFVERYPKNPMAGNAQFWLGETYYARARFLDAASAFAEGYKRYPRGTKAPDALLKLGMSLARANQKQNACVALAQLEHDFPNAGAAVKEHATAEKKRLGC